MARTWTDVLTPEEYAAVYQEGQQAFLDHGTAALSPYLNITGHETGKQHTRALAWENGWWAEHIKAAQTRKTLADAMPHEFTKGSEYVETRAYRYRDAEVVSEHGTMHDRKPWPGKEKNVYYWVVLANGYAVGWNENPARGWSFPVAKV